MVVRRSLSSWDVPHGRRHRRFGVAHATGRAGRRPAAIDLLLKQAEIALHPLHAVEHRPQILLRGGGMEGQAAPQR
ncbi:MAG: hypothetical protein WDO24_01650 [Pseudomonadota bacterium]